MKPVYRNDTDTDVWVKVTAPKGAHATLDPDAEVPYTIDPDTSATLAVEPGREVFADAKVTVEPVE